MEQLDRLQKAYDELCCYTFTLSDETFVHQYVVDANMAQTATDGSPSIGLTFALIGLYLHAEWGFSGRQVQQAHMKVARQKHAWPSFQLPSDRGSIDARHVLETPAGPERDQMISKWAKAVWATYAQNRDTVDSLVRRHGVL